MPWAMSGLAFQAALYPKESTAILLPKFKVKFFKESGVGSQEFGSETSSEFIIHSS